MQHSLLSSHSFFAAEQASVLSAISQIKDSSASFVFDPERNFTRRRMNSFENILKAPFVFSEQSLLLSITNDEFPNITIHSSDSAFCQARSKIRFEAYEQIFHNYTSSGSSNKKKFNGLQLLTCDGCELSVCQKALKKDDSLIGRSKHGGKRAFLYANFAFDPLNKEFTDVVFQPGSEKSERKAFLELVEREQNRKKRKPCCWIMDRGYESLPMFYQLQQKDVYFVCRIKDETSKCSVTKNYNLPREETYDVPFHVILCSKCTVNVDAHPDQYKLVSKASRYDFFDAEHTEAELKIRLIRYKISDENGVYWFSILTNLPKDTFSTQDVQEIYRKRWQCELAYRDLKYGACIDEVHSRTLNNIKQEVYAKMTIYNMASRIRGNLEKKRAKKKKVKYKHKIHFTNCIKIVTKFLFASSGLDFSKIDHVISKLTVPIREGRVDTRKK